MGLTEGYKHSLIPGPGARQTNFIKKNSERNLGEETTMVAYEGGVALAKEPVKGGDYGQRENIPMFTRQLISFQDLLAAVLDAGGDEATAREIFQHPLVGFGYYSLEEALKRAGLELAAC